jgi:hypothetical protein
MSAFRRINIKKAKMGEITSSFVVADSTSSANSNFMTHSQWNVIFGQFNLLRTVGPYTESISFIFRLGMSDLRKIFLKTSICPARETNF